MSDAFDRLKQRVRTSVPARDSSLLKPSEPSTGSQPSSFSLSELCEESGIPAHLLVSAGIETLLAQADLRQTWLARARLLQRHGQGVPLWVELEGAVDWTTQVVSAAEERGQSLAELIGEALSTYLGLSGDRPTLREEVETLRRDVELLKRKLTGW